MDEQILIEKVKHRILTTFPSAERILLFGSRALGTAKLDSDFDIMVVVATALSPSARVASLRTALAGLGVAFDLLVVTPAEYKRLKNWRSSAVSWADTKGKVIHETAVA